jgi:uncharacterized protein YjiS (DUF1127 family)
MTTRTAITLLHAAAETLPLRRAAPSASSWFADATATLRGWMQRMRSRETLAGLDERMLKDIGMTRAEITWETDKPFWRG